MSDYQNWDAIIALPYAGANARLQAAINQETTWRQQAWQQAATILGDGLAGLWGKAWRGGRYGQPATATATSLNGQALPARPTYRLLEVRAEAAGAGYTGPLSTFTIDIPAAKPATFTRGYGLARISITPSGTDYTSAPPVIITGPNLTGATAEAVMKAAGTGLAIDYIRITNPGTVTGSPVSATVTVAGDGVVTPTATAEIGPFVRLVDGGAGYEQFPTTAKVKTTGGGGTGFTVSFVAEVDGLLLDAPDLYYPLPAVVTANPADQVWATAPAATRDALVYTGLRVTNPGLLTGATTFAEHLRLVMAGPASSTQEVKGLLAGVVAKLWEDTDWRLKPGRTELSQAEARQECLTRLADYASGSSVLLHWANTNATQVQFHYESRAATETLADAFGDFLADAVRILWFYSDKFKPQEWYYLERGLENPDLPQYVEVAKAVVGDYSLDTANLSKMERVAILQQAFEQVQTGQLAKIGRQARTTVRALNSRWAYQPGTFTEKTWADLAQPFAPDPAWLELLLTVMGDLVPTTSSDTLFGAGTRDGITDHFKLKLGAWQLVRIANNPTKKIVFRAPVLGGVLYFGDAVVPLITGQRVAVRVQVDLPTVTRTRHNYQAFEPGRVTLLDIENLAAVKQLSGAGLTSQQQALFRAFVSRTVRGENAATGSSLPTSYDQDSFPVDYTFTFSRIFDALNVVADIPTQYQNRTGGDRSWLAPTSYFYYLNPQYDEESTAGGELSICLSMGDQPSHDNPDLNASLVPPGSQAAFYLSPRLLLRHVYLPLLAQWLYRDEQGTPAREEDFLLNGNVITLKNTLYCPNFLTDYKDQPQPLLQLRGAVTGGTQPSRESGFTLTLQADSVKLQFTQVDILTPDKSIKGTASQTLLGRYSVKDGEFRLLFQTDRFELPTLHADELSWYLKWAPTGAGVLATILAEAGVWAIKSCVRYKFETKTLARTETRMVMVREVAENMDLATSRLDLDTSTRPLVPQPQPRPRMVERPERINVYYPQPERKLLGLLDGAPAATPGPEARWHNGQVLQEYVLNHAYKYNNKQFVIEKLGRIARFNHQEPDQERHEDVIVVRRTDPTTYVSTSHVVPIDYHQYPVAGNRFRIALRVAEGGVQGDEHDQLEKELGELLANLNFNEHSKKKQAINILRGYTMAGLGVLGQAGIFLHEHLQGKKLASYQNAVLRDQFSNLVATALKDIRPFATAALVVNHAALANGLVIGFSFTDQGFTGLPVAGLPWRIPLLQAARLRTVAVVNAGHLPVRLVLARSTGASTYKALSQAVEVGATATRQLPGTDFLPLGAEAVPWGQVSLLVVETTAPLGDEQPVTVTLTFNS